MITLRALELRQLSINDDFLTSDCQAVAPELYKSHSCDRQKINMCREKRIFATE